MTELVTSRNVITCAVIPVIKWRAPRVARTPDVFYTIIIIFITKLHFFRSNTKLLRLTFFGVLLRKFYPHPGYALAYNYYLIP